MNPRIGVLIPVYNESVVIRDTIDALESAGCKVQDIYIVDDCSTDSTVKVVQSTKVNLASTPSNGGKAAAQRFAIQHFRLLEKYDWLIFMDGDTLVDSQFYHVLRDASIRMNSVSLFLGQIKSNRDDHIFSASRAIEYAYGQDVVKVGQDNFGVVFVAPGCASMYKTEVLRDLEISSDTLAEDMDLTLQIHERGLTVKYIPEAIVNTQDPSTLQDYFKQVSRWSRGFWQIVRKYDVYKLSFKKQRVHWYMLWMSLDGLLMNRIIALVLFATFNSLLTGIVIDLLIYTAMGMYGAWRSKRVDVLYKLPITYLVGYVNFYAFVKCFVEIMILRKTVLDWNKVTRYAN